MFAGRARFDGSACAAGPIRARRSILENEHATILEVFVFEGRSSRARRFATPVEPKRSSVAPLLL